MNTQPSAALATEPTSPEISSEPDTSARYSAPALDKGLDILEALSASADGYSLNQLSQVLQRNVNEIFRMVVTLERRGYIQADSSDRYTLTLKMLGRAE